MSKKPTVAATSTKEAHALGAELSEYADGLEKVLSNLITAMEEMRRDIEDLKREVRPR